MSTATARTSAVRLSAIRLDQSTQSRIGINAATVDEYAEAMRDGAAFPPVDLYGTKSACWIGDGWHRIEAARANGRKQIEAVLHRGGRKDAIRHACKANASHGLRRTIADKRHAVRLALEEFPDETDRALADLCQVSHTFVAKVRRGTGDPSSAGNVATHDAPSSGNVATTAFDFDAVVVDLKPALVSLFSRCPPERRRDLEQAVDAILREVARA